jgi:hypothetical protein
MRELLLRGAAPGDPPCLVIVVQYGSCTTTVSTRTNARRRRAMFW